ncbi:MAG: DUF3025 domain-containing protein [Betaproteobacteria bacterium]
MAPGLDAIDWAAPWLAPWQAQGQAVAAQVRTGQSCASALNSINQGGAPNAPVRFVPQQALPAGEAYEAFIFRSRQVPTREGLHDFFNGLCWLHFPHTKARLNALQADQIAQSGVQSVRGPARDGITVFDENAAFLQAPDALWQALVAKDWTRLFVTLRPLWAQALLVLFGHALLEKLVQPRKGMTAHVYRAHPGAPGLAAMDAWMAQDLSADKLAAKPFAHLPVLGVPGWWAANGDPGFYDDTSVFRAPRPLLEPGR